ncbi:MAG: hypothetical protein HOH04_02015 [Rhodospirillaceae bacterium]|nr:hypothetical protein [Rhodospirillaceae bacterium]
MADIIGISSSDNGDGESPPVVYRVDGQDRIQFVNEGWRVFAAENDDQHSAEDYIGKNIWAFMDAADGAVVLHRHLAQEVRATGRAVFLRFPCDSIEIERDLEMSILDAGNDDLVYCTRQLDVRARVSVEAPAPKPFNLCRSCGKLETPAGWFSVFDLITRALITMDRAPMTIAETTYPGCSAASRVGE